MKLESQNKYLYQIIWILIIILLNLLQLRLLQVGLFFTLPTIYKKWTRIYFYWNCQSEKPNIIVGIIYRHPSIDLTDSNCNYLNKLLENISKEQKSISYSEILMLIYWAVMSIIRQMNFQILLPLTHLYL